MEDINLLRQKLLKDGFCVIKNLIDNQETKHLGDSIKKIYNSTNNHKIVELSTYKETWNFVSNQKIISFIENSLSEKIYYMDGSISNYDKNRNYKEINSNYNSWHRDTDSAPKIVGSVPYCDENDFYKVFTITSYMNENNNDETAISLIPRSHKKKYVSTISNILRILHWKTKGKKYFFYVRNLIEKIISTKHNLKNGDCLVFFATLYHKPVSKVSTRQAIITRFAPKSKNSENYINYILKHGNRYESRKKVENNKTFIEFNKMLKDNHILY